MKKMCERCGYSSDKIIICGLSHYEYTENHFTAQAPKIKVQDITGEISNEKIR
jgi:hypothetical protein